MMHPDELSRKLQALNDELAATPNDLEALDRLEGRIRLGDFDGVVPQNLLNELARRRVAIKRAQRKEWVMDNRTQAQGKLDELWAEYDVLYNLYDLLGGGMYHALGGRHVNVPALERMIGKTSNEIGELTAYLAEADKGVPDWLNKHLDGDVPGEPIKGAPEAKLVEMNKKSKRGLRGVERTVASLSAKQQQLLDIMKPGGFILFDRIGMTQRSMARLFDKDGNQVDFKLLAITATALERRKLIERDLSMSTTAWLIQQKWVYKDWEKELQDTLDRIKSKR